jgi:hypothetical protein
VLSSSPALPESLTTVSTAFTDKKLVDYLLTAPPSDIRSALLQGIHVPLLSIPVLRQLLDDTYAFQYCTHHEKRFTELLSHNTLSSSPTLSVKRRRVQKRLWHCLSRVEWSVLCAHVWHPLTSSRVSPSLLFSALRHLPQNETLHATRTVLTHCLRLLTASDNASVMAVGDASAVLMLLVHRLPPTHDAFRTFAQLVWNNSTLLTHFLAPQQPLLTHCILSLHSSFLLSYFDEQTRMTHSHSILIVERIVCCVFMYC